MSLQSEVEQFQKWATERFSPGFDDSQCFHGIEWECDYPNWADLYQAVEELLSERSAFTAEEVSDLLFSLARDNEDECIMDMLSEHPKALFELCDAPEEMKEKDSR